jgi:hypothetical protein
MAIEIVTVPGGVFALWGVPAKRDMDRLVDAAQAEARECGHGVIYISRIPASQPAPSADVLRYLAQQMPALSAAISSSHVVLEGEGFGAALKRGVLTGIFQLLGRTTLVVHSVASDVPRDLESAHALVVNQLLEVAKAQGLLDAPGPFMTLRNAVAKHERRGSTQATATMAAIGAHQRLRAR